MQTATRTDGPCRSDLACVYARQQRQPAIEHLQSRTAGIQSVNEARKRPQPRTRGSPFLDETDLLLSRVSALREVHDGQPTVRAERTENHSHRRHVSDECPAAFPTLGGSSDPSSVGPRPRDECRGKDSHADTKAARKLADRSKTRIRPASDQDPGQLPSAHPRMLLKLNLREPSSIACLTHCLPEGLRTRKRLCLP
jgi:hypothetical protein